MVTTRTDDDGRTWSVELDGRTLLVGESYTVASRVAYALTCDACGTEYSETDELAAALA